MVGGEGRGLGRFLRFSWGCTIRGWFVGNENDEDGFEDGWRWGVWVGLFLLVFLSQDMLVTLDRYFGGCFVVWFIRLCDSCASWMEYRRMGNISLLVVRLLKLTNR